MGALKVLLKEDSGSVSLGELLEGPFTSEHPISKTAAPDLFLGHRNALLGGSIDRDGAGNPA